MWVITCTDRETGNDYAFLMDGVGKEQARGLAVDAGHVVSAVLPLVDGFGGQEASVLDTDGHAVPPVADFDPVAAELIARRRRPRSSGGSTFMGWALFIILGLLGHGALFMLWGRIVIPGGTP